MKNLLREHIIVHIYYLNQ